MSNILDDVKSIIGTTDPEAAAITVRYKNYRGKTSDRRIIPLGVSYGSTEYHKEEEQWILRVWDLDKRDYRTYALKDIEQWTSFLS
ncbi:MAG: hypothetical protein ABIH92_05150 [Nanoarchaeota archaeon]